MLMIAAMVLSMNAKAGPLFQATAYTPTCDKCLGVTKWRGLIANPWGPIKMMAVDPNVLTLGKCYRLRFVDDVNDGHDSIYLAADVGGGVRGYELDLLVKSTTSAENFGIQVVEVIGQVSCPVDPYTLPRRK